ncbi:5442_t:CDS:2 [Dentiscutata erythropus]|uniref:dihydrolipoyllysine-residue succinyltransferase n=1 Tax=Dentiscutata erythropus TaxID=1348616 RepID=A0A9N9ED30_9GLOM|nr:5442_t:CDS:2 [Dentiscutata erythropus]
MLPPSALSTLPLSSVSLQPSNQAKGVSMLLIDAVLKKHSVKLGFMSTFVKASTIALQKVPPVNASIAEFGDTIIFRNYVNMSIAVAIPKEPTIFSNLILFGYYTRDSLDPAIDPAAGALNTTLRRKAKKKPQRRSKNLLNDEI